LSNRNYPHSHFGPPSQRSPFGTLRVRRRRIAPVPQRTVSRPSRRLVIACASCFLAVGANRERQATSMVGPKGRRCAPSRPSWLVGSTATRVAGPRHYLWMLLALIADTHVRDGRPLLPKRCVELIAAADLVVHAGDMADLAALEQLRAIGPPVVAVRGNVDDPALAALLPEVEQVVTAGCVVGVIHDAGPGAGRLERMRRLFPTAAAVVFGHSHVPLHETALDGFQIYNPGSPTFRRRQPGHTMGVAHVDDGRISFKRVALD